MDLWDKVTGTTQLEIISADPEGMLNQLMKQNIILWDVERASPILLRLRLSSSDVEKVFFWSEKAGGSVQILGVNGILYSLRSWLRRPVILFCLFFVTVLTLMLPERILFVDVSGNSRVPSRMILEAAQEQGLKFGASRRALRSEAVKNELLGSLNELEWVGVNTYGCRAVIQVRERKVQPEEIQTAPSDLVASTDGIIEQIVVNRGTLLCKPGQAVRKDEKLISGYLDLGICTRATGAQGEIYARTNRVVHAVLPASVLKRSPGQKEKTRIALIIGKKRINLYSNSGILPAGCGKMTYNYPLRLPGADALPVTLVIERIVWYDIGNALRDQQRAQQLMLNEAQRYLMNKCVAGQILTHRTDVHYGQEQLSLLGVFQCREMIARQKAVEILEGDTQDDSQNSQRGAG